MTLGMDIEYKASAAVFCIDWGYAYGAPEVVDGVPFTYHVVKGGRVM